MLLGFCCYCPPPLCRGTELGCVCQLLTFEIDREVRRREIRPGSNAPRLDAHYPLSPSAGSVAFQRHWSSRLLFRQCACHIKRRRDLPLLITPVPAKDDVCHRQSGFFTFGVPYDALHNHPGRELLRRA